MDTVVIMVVKSDGEASMQLFDGQSDILNPVESETFQDLYTLNFHLQTLASKYKIKKGLIVVHDKAKNSVALSIAKDDNSFFIS